MILSFRVNFLIYVNYKTQIRIDGILPYSLFKITYLIELKFFKHAGEVLLKAILHQWDKINTTDMLSKLEDKKIYAATVEFIVDYNLYNDKDPYPKLLLDQPIVLTKDSETQLVSNFIYEKIIKMADYYKFDESILDQTDNGPVVLLSLTEIEVK